MPHRRNLPEAQLDTINYVELRNGSEVQAEKLFQVCKHHGIFYLDLTALQATEGLQTTVEEMYSLVGKLFDLPVVEKMQFDIDKNGTMKVCGYKPSGRNTGGIAGKRDGFETFAIPKDHLYGAETFSLPPVIQGQLETVKQFASAMLNVNHTLLSTLSRLLEVPYPGRLEDYHRASKSSPDIVRLLQYSPQPQTEPGIPHAAHTDLGTTTILFADQGGLQVLPPGSQNWQYVMPRENHAILNLGDGMSLLTNGLFHSCLHRVAPMPGETMRERRSFAYMLRAEDRTPMTGLDSRLIPAAKLNSEVVTSMEWLQRKYEALRLITTKKQDSWRITGGQEDAEERSSSD